MTRSPPCKIRFAAIIDRAGLGWLGRDMWLGLKLNSVVVKGAIRFSRYPEIRRKWWSSSREESRKSCGNNMPRYTVSSIAFLPVTPVSRLVERSLKILGIDSPIQPKITSPMMSGSGRKAK